MGNTVHMLQSPVLTTCSFETLEELEAVERDLDFEVWNVGPQGRWLSPSENDSMN